ncbi:hypothetical protein [Pelomicrobium sp.]|jgi:hypothetical protein|uniref:hypothetical protein n=1 Tax=Pelomicrobium sp. TaxID=2815319 RepID=UPI002FDE87F6
MQEQAKKVGGRRPAAQSGSLGKQNAWWRQVKLARALRRYPYVISEGDVWFGRKTPDQRAFVWFQADAFLGEAAANDEMGANGE